MKMKNAYDPGQKHGLNVFEWHGEEVIIVHPGAYLYELIPGQLVLFRRYDGLVWCGRTWPDFYAFELEKPMDAWDALQYLADLQRMRLANQDSDFSGQEQLPF